MKRATTVLIAPELCQAPSRDLKGARFSKLLVLKFAGRVKRKPYWECRCDCGEQLVTADSSLVRGGTQSCGCLRDSILSQRNKTSPSKKLHPETYKVWKLMRRRCNSPSSTGYKYYGAKGVKVDPAWDSFENFLKYMGPRPEGGTIDRINPFGNYEPGNCKWSTMKEQNRNKKVKVLFEYNGKSKMLSEWAENFNLSYNALYFRIKRGLSMHEALTSPLRRTLPPKNPTSADSVSATTERHSDSVSCSPSPQTQDQSHDGEKPHST